MVLESFADMIAGIMRGVANLKNSSRRCKVLRGVLGVLQRDDRRDGVAHNKISDGEEHNLRYRARAKRLAFAPIILRCCKIPSLTHTGLRYLRCTVSCGCQKRHNSGREWTFVEMQHNDSALHRYNRLRKVKEATRTIWRLYIGFAL